MDDFIDAYLDWTKEILDIEAQYKEAFQAARDDMARRMRAPGSDLDEVVADFNEKWRRLDEKRTADRHASDAKNKHRIDKMHASS